MLLASGGDQRIWPDPVTRRNRYGTLCVPCPSEISFASTTASTIAEGGFAAASIALDALLAGEPPERWFDRIRDNVRAVLGAPTAEVILAASGTDAELLALALSSALSRRPLTNIIVAPDETGKSVPIAAKGCHFSDWTALGEQGRKGQLIDGLPGDIEVRAIALRDARARPLDAAAVDAMVARTVEEELKRGRDVLLHILDASKTGLCGPSREMARQLALSAGTHVRVVVDACQLRCPLSLIGADLADGFMVAVTGSKFAAGPAYAGALLLPDAMIDAVADAELAAGMSAYCAALDLPERLRHSMSFTPLHEANIGLALRWEAALEGLSGFARIDEAQQALILGRFVSEVRERAGAIGRSARFEADLHREHAFTSIVPLTLSFADGALARAEDAERLQRALRDPAFGPVCHIGQGVTLAGRTMLRVAASALDVVRVGERLASGEALNAAFAPVAHDLDTLFAKWAAVTMADT